MSALLKLDVEDLSPQMRLIVETIGLPATVRLHEWRSGVRIFVPIAPNDSHELVRRIGLVAARKLAETFGSGELLVPRADRALRAVRNREILRRYEAGESAWTLCGEYNVSERQFWNIIVKTRDASGGGDPAQPDLF